MIRGIVRSEFGLLVGLVILFGILWGLTKFPAPISTLASTAEKYAQPHN